MRSAVGRSGIGGTRAESPLLQRRNDRVERPGGGRVVKRALRARDAIASPGEVVAEVRDAVWREREARDGREEAGYGEAKGDGTR